MRYAANIFIVFILIFSLSGCADRKTINGRTYDTYGVFSEGSTRNGAIEYEVSIGNVIWGILLAETIIAPVYFFGFALFEPVRPLRINPNMKGVVTYE